MHRPWQAYKKASDLTVVNPRAVADWALLQTHAASIRLLVLANCIQHGYIESIVILGQIYVGTGPTTGLLLSRFCSRFVQFSVPEYWLHAAQPTIFY